MSTDQTPAEQTRKAGRRPVFGVQYSTTESLGGLEDWLDGHCQGKWSMALEDIDEKNGKKTVKILFDEPGDKQRFIAHFARKKTPPK